MWLILITSSFHYFRVIDGSFNVPTNPVLNFIVNTLDCGCERVDNIDVSKAKAEVYNFETNKNYTYSLESAAESILNRNDFNPNQCIQIFVPGLFAPNVNDAVCIFSNMVCNGMKVLGIIIDYSAYTNGNVIDKTLLIITTYYKVVKYVKSIGVRFGKMLVKLLTKVDRDKLDILSHSLGAHMSGYAGQVVIQDTGVPLKRIYAADPAGPCFANCMSEHVKSGNADLVVTFHCNAGQLGSVLNVADFDFYAGNGVIQAGCGTYDLLLNYIETTCSHLRCAAIMGVPALYKQIWNSVKCESAEAYSSGQCGSHETALGGYTITPNASSGVYYFSPPIKVTCELPPTLLTN